MFDATAILIPAYEPGDRLLALVRELQPYAFGALVVVDDGSATGAVFAQLKQQPGVTVLVHQVNLGKGAALKTGFLHIAQHYADEIATIITLDADGQHLCGDVIKVAEECERNRRSLVLGVRDFGESMPLRSELGNRVTRWILERSSDIDITDTQTGLRGLPVAFAKDCCAIDSDRYQFELECILLARNSGVEISETAISTIYIDGNSSSHFRPLVDSLRIYVVFARFISVSLASFLIDISLFALSFLLTSDVYASTFFARAVSSMTNFLGNKLFVFRSRGRPAIRTTMEIAGYILLVVFVASMSAFAVDKLHDSLAGNIVLTKIAVDACLFFVSFATQRFLLFARPDEGEARR